MVAITNLDIAVIVVSLCVGGWVWILIQVRKRHRG